MSTERFLRSRLLTILKKTAITCPVGSARAGWRGEQLPARPDTRVGNVPRHVCGEADGSTRRLVPPLFFEVRPHEGEGRGEGRDFRHAVEALASRDG